MKILFNLAVVYFALLMGLDNPASATEAAREVHRVNGNVTKVYLNGVIDVQIRQGATPSLTIVGDTRLLPYVQTEQKDDALKIQCWLPRHFAGRPRVRAELVLPAITELISIGRGNSDISGFSGEEFQVKLEGNGGIHVDSRFSRIYANLSGLGHMMIHSYDGDEIYVSLPGAGRITLTGKTRELFGTLGGMGNLDARTLKAESLTLELEGMSSAAVNAKNTANIDLNGVGSVVVYGHPVNRFVRVNGIGKVMWK